MIIRTVLGDIPPEAAGIAFAHEHLIIDSALVAENWPHIHLPSVAEATAEIGLCAAAGVRTMVDTMPIGAGGDPVKLALVSRATGVNVVSSSGMHTAKYYQGVGWASDPAERLAGRFIGDVRSRGAGTIKLATAQPAPSGQERRVFEAGAAAHIETGAPIITHCEGGQGGLEQVGLLARHGVDPGRVILSHTDKVADSGYHRDLLETGVSLVYDQGLRQIDADPLTARLVATAWELGFGSRILLGTDGARRSLWTSLGGSPGLAWLAVGFPSLLADRGVGPGEVEAMLVDNPARALAFAP